MRTRRLLRSTVALALLAGCGPAAHHVDEAGNVRVDDGKGWLVADTHTEIQLTPEAAAPAGTAALAAAAPAFGYTITQIGSIQPTTVRRHAVQANDILISGNRAYVAYNTAGPVFDGAIQFFKIEGSRVVLTVEIAFAEMDIISLALDGDDLVFGGMANPDVFDGHRSFIGRVSTKGPSAAAVVASYTWLSSYAATGVAPSGGRTYVGVGAAGGGVEVLDAAWGRTGFLPADDVRDLDAWSGGVVALSGTSPEDAASGRILLLEEGAVSTSIAIPAFDSPEAKATVEVNGGYAYLGLSAKGFQVCDLSAKEIVLTVPNPDADPDHVTNSISFDGDLIFSANGEYGLRVFDYTPPGAAAVVGYYGYAGLVDRTGQNYSANQVAYRNGNLFVASGVGGVQVFQLARK